MVMGKNSKSNPIMMFYIKAFYKNATYSIWETSFKAVT